MAKKQSYSLKQYKYNLLKYLKLLIVETILNK